MTNDSRSPSASGVRAAAGLPRKVMITGSPAIVYRSNSLVLFFSSTVLATRMGVPPVSLHGYFHSHNILAPIGGCQPPRDPSPDSAWRGRRTRRGMAIAREGARRRGRGE